MKLQVEITVRKPEAEVAQLLFDEDFSDWLFETLEFRVRRRLFCEEHDSGWRDAVQYEPAFTLPSLIKKALKGRTLGWEERRAWCARKRQLRSVIVPNIMAERVTIDGTVSFSKLAIDRTRVHFNHRVEVRYPILGGVVERLITSDMRKNFLASERLIHEYQPPLASSRS